MFLTMNTEKQSLFFGKILWIKVSFVYYELFIQWYCDPSGINKSNLLIGHPSSCSGEADSQGKDLLISNVVLRWWIATQKSLAWRLLHIVKIGDKSEKQRAIRSLANLKTLSGESLVAALMGYLSLWSYMLIVHYFVCRMGLSDASPSMRRPHSCCSCSHRGL